MLKNWILFAIFAIDVVGDSKNSTGRNPLCRGGFSQNYTLIGEFLPVLLAR